MLIAKTGNGKPKVKGQATMQEHLANYNSRADRLVESWNRTRVGVKLDRLYSKNPQKARKVALSLEAEAKHLKHLKEEGTQIKTLFSTRPENVLRIIRVGVAQSNRDEFCHEWQLVTPDDAFYFVDTIYGSTKRGATAGDLVYEDVQDNYATEMNKITLGTGNGATLSFTATFSPLPLVPLSIRILVNGKHVGSDDETGGFTGSIINTTSSAVDYNTGVITVVFTAGNAPANGVLIQAEGNWDSEKSDNYDEWGSVELRLRRSRFNARPMPLTYQYSKMFELVLGTTGVGDAEEMLIKRVGDVHAKRKDTKALQILRRQALTNAVTSFDADFSTVGSDNLYNHAQTILQTIEKMSGNLFDDIQRGRLNKMIIGTQLAAFMKMHKLWSSDVTQPRVGGSYYAGKLDDIDVYIAPKNDSTVKNNEALLTYRNPDEDGDVNVAFGVMTELSAALDYPELYRKGSLVTVEDYKPINDKFTRLLTVENL